MYLAVRRGERGSVSSQRAADAWQVKAACRGPQATVFFPPAYVERRDQKEEREQRAKAICATCRVGRPCLEYAVEVGGPHGIWGGLNEVEGGQLLAGP